MNSCEVYRKRSLLLPLNIAFVNYGLKSKRRMNLCFRVGLWLAYCYLVSTVYWFLCQTEASGFKTRHKHSFKMRPPIGDVTVATSVFYAQPVLSIYFWGQAQMAIRETVLVFAPAGFSFQPWGAVCQKSDQWRHLHQNPLYSIYKLARVVKPSNFKLTCPNTMSYGLNFTKTVWWAWTSPQPSLVGRVWSEYEKVERKLPDGIQHIHFSHRRWQYGTNSQMANSSHKLCQAQMLLLNESIQSSSFILHCFTEITAIFM